MNNDDPLKDRVYYSQNREDLILEAFFPDVKNGFYVDVGASDPNKYSVTKLFYEQGWCGINIEPIKHHFKALQTERPHDTNLNVGVGRRKATLTFHEYTGGDGLSTFSSEMAQEYAEQEDFPFKDSKEYEVAVQTLKDVFTEQKITKINFLKVDVEGFEYDVLAGNDWDAYRPEVICIEANHITDDWRPLLIENDYKLAFFDGLNEYYTDIKTDRQSRFNFVDNVVIKHDGGISANDYKTIVDLRAELKKTHLRLQTALAEATHKSELHSQALAENHKNYIRAVNAEYALKNPRAFAKQAVRGLHGKVLRKLSPTPPITDQTPEDKMARAAEIQQLSAATSDQQRLKIAQSIAVSELDRMKHVYTVGDSNQAALRFYLQLVNTAKYIRSKKVKR